MHVVSNCIQYHIDKYCFADDMEQRLCGAGKYQFIFSSFYFGSPAITLPLELVYLKVHCKTIQRCCNGKPIMKIMPPISSCERSADGSNFGRIGTVAADGNSASVKQYVYTDNEVSNLSASTVYYRLKLVDIDGQYKYSSVVTIYLADITSRIVVSPNPTTGETKVMIAATISGKAQWTLTDNSGRVVMQNIIAIKKGNNNLAINVSGLSAGIYYLNVTGAGIDQHVKLQKL